MDWRQLKSMNINEWIKNIILYAIGVGIMPLGVVLTVNAHLGAGGYDALNFAVADTLGIQTSYAIYLTAFLVLLLTAAIRRGFPRIETFISSFFLGLSTDFWQGVLENVEGKNLINAVILLMLGMVVIAFAIACYMISVFPTNPTDDLIVALQERGVRIRVAKTTMDVVCVVLAFLLGGEIGVGTIICTVGLGVIIDMFHKNISKILKIESE